MNKQLILFAGTIVYAIACEQVRPRSEPTVCLTFEEDIRPLLAQRCVTCHSGPTPAGQYDLSSYLGTLGPSVDASAVLTKLEPTRADAPHQLPDADRARLADWVDCGLALRRSALHEPGLLNPRDPQFHGALLAQKNYRFDLCARCHGDDFSGGSSKSSCNTCHSKGPTDCSTCHNTLTAPHAAHEAYDCALCHPTPTRWDDEGHILVSGAIDPPPVEVVFSQLANAELPAHPRDRAAQFSDGRCEGSYCHGGLFDQPAPRWANERLECGDCHGLPPPDHAQADCQKCHSQVASAERVIEPTLHINGTIELGESDEGCLGCHGTPDAPAPQSGAHAAHLAPELYFSSPIDCGNCHLVPQTVEQQGHIDSAEPAEVFPPSIQDALSFARGSAPIWIATANTCENVYCHGEQSPSWFSGRALVCGDCHGLPPTDANHEQSWEISTCVSCHPTAVDRFGNVARKEHIDGQVDL